MATTRTPFMKIESTETCQECGVTTHTYRRFLHYEMLQFLRQLAANRGWMTSREMMPDGPKASSDGAYLVHWGFVEKRRRGEYRATTAGYQFLAGRRKAPTYLRMRDGNLLGWSTKYTDVRELARRG